MTRREWGSLLTYLAAAALWIVGPECRAEYAEFGAVTDTIAIFGETTLSTAATFEAVLRLDVDTYGSLFREQGDSTELKSLAVGANRLEGFAAWTPTDPGGFSAAAALTPDEFHHVAFVHWVNRGLKHQRLYLDGVLIGSRTATAADNLINNAASALFPPAIGASQVNASAEPVPSFIGMLDSVRVSNAARYSGSSFTAPMGDMSADADTLLLYNFNIDEIDDNVVIDLSGKGHHGTLGIGFLEATSPAIVSGANSADFNRDGAIDAADFVVWRKNAGLIGTATQSIGDADGDGDVDDVDYLIWNASFEATLPGGEGSTTAGVPEPTGILVAMFAAAICWGSARWRR